jgi:hypothetical protein
MNSQQIETALRKRCPDFESVLAADQLPLVLPSQRPLMYVVNTDPQSRPGTHWIAMYFGLDDVCEYFDSFGRRPSLVFERYLNGRCSEWIFNDKQLQSVVSGFCGQYCLVYCILKSRGKSLSDILKYFSSDTGLNDFLVHKFTCRMF